MAFARWHVEKWFERTKQEAGFGAFEVRTYRSLIRRWLCSRMVMYFLAAQTQRLRGEKSADHAGAGGGGGRTDPLTGRSILFEDRSQFGKIRRASGPPSPRMNAVQTYDAAINYLRRPNVGYAHISLVARENGVDRDYTHAPALFTA